MEKGERRKRGKRRERGKRVKITYVSNLTVADDTDKLKGMSLG